MRTDSIFTGYDNPNLLKELEEIPVLYEETVKALEEMQKETDYRKGLTEGLKAYERYFMRRGVIDSYIGIMDELDQTSDSFNEIYNEHFENLDEYRFTQLFAGYIEKIPNLTELTESTPYLRNHRRFIYYMAYNASISASPEEEEELERLGVELDQANHAYFDEPSIQIGDQLYTPEQIWNQEYPEANKEKTEKLLEDYSKRFFERSKISWKYDVCFKEIYHFPSILHSLVGDDGLDEEVLDDLMESLRYLNDEFTEYDKCWGGALKNPQDICRLEDMACLEHEGRLVPPVNYVGRVKEIFSKTWPEFAAIGDEAIENDWIDYGNLSDCAGDCYSRLRDDEFRIMMKETIHSDRIIATVAHEFAHAYGSRLRKQAGVSDINVEYSRIQEEVFSRWADIYAVRVDLNSQNLYAEYWKDILERLGKKKLNVPVHTFFDEVQMLLFESDIMTLVESGHEIIWEEMCTISEERLGSSMGWLNNGTVLGHFKEMNYVVARLLAIMIDDQIMENDDVMPDSIKDLWCRIDTYTIREIIEHLTGKQYDHHFWRNLIDENIVRPIRLFKELYEHVFDDK